MWVLTAGLGRRLAGWLDTRLPGVGVVSAPTGGDVLRELSAENYEVLVLDGRIADPSAYQVLSRLQEKGARPFTIYCAEARIRGLLDGWPFRETVDSVLFPPLDRERLAAEVAHVLRIPLLPGGAGRTGSRRLPRREPPSSTVMTRLNRLLEGLLGATPGLSLRKTAQEATRLASFLDEMGFVSGSRLARALARHLERPEVPPEERHLRCERFLQLCGEICAPLPRRATFPEDWPRLLVVEADTVFAAALGSEAASRGVSATLVDEPSGAMETFLRLRPDGLVLSLPEGDQGWTLLRALSEADPFLPIVVLRDRASLADARETSRLGSRRLFGKPLPASFIIDEILMQMDRLPSDRFEVLICHGSSPTLERLRGILTAWDFRVTPSEGRDFWDRLEESNPDLILLSESPGAEGLALCRALRTEPRHVHRSVLFLAEPGEPTLPAYRAGADDCLHLPVGAAELIGRVSSHLHRSRARAAMSGLDPLTGLVRWPGSAQAVARLLQLAARHAEAASVALLRPDAFESLLRSHGRLEGNRRLRWMAGLLQSTFRDEDVVTRWGECEFLVAMYSMNRADGIRRLAEVADRLGQLEHAVPFDVSAGVAEFPEDGTEFQTLYRVAFEALERASEAGGGRIVYAGWMGPQASEPFDVALVTPTGSPAGVALQRALRIQGYSSHRIESGAPQPAALESRAVLIDHSSGRDAQALLAPWMEHQEPDTPIIVLNPARDDGFARAAAALGLAPRVDHETTLAEVMRVLRRRLGCRGAWTEHAEGLSGRDLTLFRQLSMAQRGWEAAEEENARLLQKAQSFSSELELARNVQEALLPLHSPRLEGWSIEYRVTPARVVGGDLVKFFRQGPQLGVALADVTGKGIPAAILVGCLHQILQQAHALPVTEAMEQINETLCLATPPEVAVALILALLDPLTGEVQFANAGSPSPLLYRARQREIEVLADENLPLGWFDDARTSVHRLTLDAGDTLLLYTDGLCDAFVDGTRERVGETRIHEALLTHQDLDLKRLAARLLELAVSPSQPDDVGIVLIRRSMPDLFRAKTRDESARDESAW